jgi:hypothetical protein
MIKNDLSQSVYFIERFRSKSPQRRELDNCDDFPQTDQLINYHKSPYMEVLNNRSRSPYRENLNDNYKPPEKEKSNNYYKFPERDKPNNNRKSPQKWGLYNRFEPLCEKEPKQSPIISPLRGTSRVGFADPFDQITLRNELDNRSRSPVRRSDDRSRSPVRRSDIRSRSPTRKADIRSESPIRNEPNNHNVSPQRKYVNERCKSPQREETEHRNTSPRRKRSYNRCRSPNKEEVSNFSRSPQRNEKDNPYWSPQRKQTDNRCIPPSREDSDNFRKPSRRRKSNNRCRSPQRQNNAESVIEEESVEIKRSHKGSIYVLELENGKYYVGSTNNFERRYQEHLNGEGSSWTKIHKPVKILEVNPWNSPYDEDNKTKELMAKYGVNNVRGGSYTTIHLDEAIIKFINKETQTRNNLCYNCSSKEHFARDCPYKNY